MKKVNIRPANSNNLDAISKLQEDLAGENIIYGFLPKNKEQLAQKLGQYFLIVEINDEIVGFVYGSEHTSTGLAVIPKGQKYFEIDDIYVKPELRGMDIGNQLLNRITQIAKRNGIERFLVYSSSKDTQRILKFYESHGFKPWYIQLFK